MMLRRSSRAGISAITERFGRKSETIAQGRLSRRLPVAVIDIGSNSVRQVIYEGLTRAPAVLFNEKVLCGLGHGVSTTGRLEQEGVDRALAAIRRFRALGRQAGVGDTHILATAAAREAANGPQFIAQVEAETGATVTLLTGRMEAHLAAWGIRSGFHKPDGIAGDLGGGSLELVGINGEIEGGITLPLGGLRLMDMAGGSLGKAAAITAKALKEAEVDWPGSQRNFYAVGGTWRSLAKLHIASTDYPLPVVHDYAVDADTFCKFCDCVAEGELETMTGIDAVSRNRQSLLPYGAMVMAATLRQLGAKRLLMSSLGVREGFLHTLLSEEERAEDSLLAAAYDLAILRARSPRHSVELAEFTGRAFATFGVDENDNETRYRIASCYLADIAWRAHPDYRAQQSLSIISNAGFVGISHEGRAYLALANYHRYRGIGGKAKPPEIAALAGDRISKRARLLAALFRVLYLFSASMPGVIPRLEFSRRGEGFALLVPGDMSGLLGERPLERLANLGRELEVEIDVEIAG